MAQAGYDFEEWRLLLQTDLNGAVDRVMKMLKRIPEADRSKVLARLPERGPLSRRFEAARDRLGEPLGGVPFALKDLFDVEGEATGCGSVFAAEVRGPARATCPLVKRLEELGAGYVCRTQLNEFAYGLSGENPHFGDCPHPILPEAYAGGSSSGSAYLVGAGIMPLALGTDTGGSIRVPAAYCGLYGYRLGPDDYAREGCFPLAPSFDTAGWFTQNAGDMCQTLEALLPHAGLDEGTQTGLRGLYTEGPTMAIMPGLQRRYRKLARVLDVEENPLWREEIHRAFQQAALHYGVLQSREAYSVHAEWLDEHRHRYDPVVWKRIDRGRHWRDDQIEAALQKEREILATLTGFFAEYDFLAMPATPTAAPYKEDLDENFRNELLALTTPGSFARLPILTLPVFLEDGSSGGLQVILSARHSAAPIEILHRAAAFYR